MTLAELYAMLQGIIGTKRVCFNAFPEKESPGLPFACIVAGRSDNFGADNITYHTKQSVTIEYYSKAKDLAAEAQIESGLTEAEIYFESDEMYLSDERCYEKIYEVII